MMVLIPIVGLGIDGATLYAIRMRMSQAVDAAALAGARSLNAGQDLNSQTAAAQAVALKYLHANFPAGFWGSTNLSTPSPTVAQDDVSHRRTVYVTAAADAPLYFMNILNKQTARVQVSAMASRRDINIMMVLDRSQSMQQSNSIDPMKQAASWFVGQFSAGRDKVGLEVFGGGTYVAYTPKTTFKSDSPSVPSLINQLTAGGYTNTSQALWQGYLQLKNLNQPGAFNVILLFTDGQPTAFTGQFQVSSSTCYNKSDKIGALRSTGSGSPSGIFQYFDVGIADTATEGQLVANSSGCAYASRATDVDNDVQKLPSTDYWGNSISNGYQSVNLNNVSSGTNIQNAAINAADSAASRIRTDSTLGPVIYTIGLGGVGGPETAFMQRISNDPASVDFDRNEAPGLYVYAPDNTQLQAAFARIASELLRLAQ